MTLEVQDCDDMDGEVCLFDCHYEHLLGYLD